MSTIAIENFLEALKVKNFQKTRRIFWAESGWSRLDFQKKNQKVRVSCNIKCLRRRTVLIQRALCSPDLGKCFTYPEHVPNCYRNFFRGSQSQKLSQKHKIFLGKICFPSGKFCQNLKLLFMHQYKIIYVSYESDSKCAVFPLFRRWFFLAIIPLQIV